MTGRGLHRRTFLAGTGALVGALASGLVLGACESGPAPAGAGSAAGGGGSVAGNGGSVAGPGSAGTAGTTGTTPGSSSTTAPATKTRAERTADDLKVAALAASLENLAVEAYTEGLRTASSGQLGSVAPAVPTFLTTALDQHRGHAKAWNAMLRAAGKPAVTTADPAIAPTVRPALAKVTDVTSLLTLALDLENTAAQTYQVGSTVVWSTKAVRLAASIQPVEMQHAAILYLLLGKYPGVQSPSGQALAFNPTTLARPVTDYQGAL
ncbi:MAG: ferritin-like domain-containing protein [Acidimicrobiales bacterium]